jgi:hypothetical protein
MMLMITFMVEDEIKKVRCFMAVSYIIFSMAYTFNKGYIVVTGDFVKLSVMRLVQINYVVDRLFKNRLGGRPVDFKESNVFKIP